MSFGDLFWGGCKETTHRMGSKYPWERDRPAFSTAKIGQIYAELRKGGRSRESSPQTALFYSAFWNGSSHNTTATLFVPLRALHYASRPPTPKDVLLVLGDPEHTENRALSQTGV